MAEVGFSLSSQGAREYRDLAKRLRGAARKGMRTELRKRIVEAGRPVVDEVKSNVTGLPVTGSHGGGTSRRRGHAVSRAKATDRARRAAGRRPSGLRRSIANATKLQITPRGIRIIVDSNRLPVDQKHLPRHLDSPKGWRHPFFGDRKRWYHQQGKPYFAVTVKRRAPQFRQAIQRAVDDVKSQLSR